MPKCISSENDKIRTSLGVKCPQDDLCGLEFNMVADLREGDTVLCPHCLRPMRFVDGFPFREEKANLK